MCILGSAPAPPILSNYGFYNKLNFRLFHVYIESYNSLSINYYSFLFFFPKGTLYSMHGIQNCHQILFLEKMLNFSLSHQNYQ